MVHTPPLKSMTLAGRLCQQLSTSEIATASARPVQRLGLGIENEHLCRRRLGVEAMRALDAQKLVAVTVASLLSHVLYCASFPAFPPALGCHRPRVFGDRLNDGRQFLFAVSDGLNEACGRWGNKGVRLLS